MFFVSGGAEKTRQSNDSSREIWFYSLFYLSFVLFSIYRRSLPTQQICRHYLRLNVRHVHNLRNHSGVCVRQRIRMLISRLAN